MITRARRVAEVMADFVPEGQQKLGFLYSSLTDYDVPGCAFLQLWIGENSLWLGRDGRDGIVRRWDDFLIGLAENWKYLLLEEAYPSSTQPRRPTELSKLLRWEMRNSSAEGRRLLVRAGLNFRSRHDLSYYAGGAALRSITLVREGPVFIADWVAACARLDFARTVQLLEQLGNEISSHLRTVDDYRCAMASLQWEGRDEISPSIAFSIQTGMNIEYSAELLHSGAVRPFTNVVEAAWSQDEFVALTRMVGYVLPLRSVKNVFRRLRRLPHYSTDLLERLSRQAQEVVSKHKDLAPHEQGRKLAQWFRTIPGVVNRQNVTNDVGILRMLRVYFTKIQIDSSAIDALAVWGSDRGPAVLLNENGKHSSTGGGRRATIAHEICHLLIDRKHALPVAEALGGKMPVAIEQRAKAFAAELLLPQEIAAAEFRNSANVWEALEKLTIDFAVTRSLAAIQLLHADGLDLSAEEKHDLQSYVRPELETVWVEPEGDSPSDLTEDFLSAGFSMEIGEMFKFAVRQAVTEHHEAGRSIYEQREGKIVEVPPSLTKH
jgi:Zn-dependent peptidase ImmA (M78 family)